MQPQRIMLVGLVLVASSAGEVRAQSQDPNRIFAADVSGNESFLATGHEDGTIEIFDLRTRKIVNTIRFTDALIDIIKFVPDDDHTIAVVNSRYSGTVNFLDTITGKQIWRVKAAYSVADLSFSTNGVVMAVGCYDGTIDLWQVKNRAHLRDVRQRVAADTVSVSPNGKFLLAGGEDSTIRLWSIDDGQLAWKQRAHHAMVTSVDFSSNGELFLSAANNGEIKIWRTKDRSELTSLQSTGYGADTVFSKASESVLVGPGEIIRWKQKRTDRLVNYPDTADSAMMFEFDGGNSFAVTQGGEVRYWSLKTLAPVSSGVDKSVPTGRFERDPLGPTVTK